MRYFFTIILLFKILFSGAQFSAEEIRKYNIYKITEKSFVNDSLTKMTTYYFDKYGNIFKETCGNMTESTVNEYESERLKRVVDYDLNGKEEHITEYFYNRDGTYMTISTEKNFGAKNYVWYKANGDILKAIGVDTFFYKYNEQDKLVGIESDGGNKEKASIIYSYNAKDQLVKMETQQTDNFKLAEDYEYDLKGKRIKAIEVTIVFGDTTITTTTFEYNEKGFLVKEIISESKNRGKITTRINVYEHEFYKN